MELVTVGIIANKAGIPETTVRRYLLNFEDFFFSKRIGRATKYKLSCVALVKEINTLYTDGYSTADIREQLSTTTAYSPSTVASGGNVGITTIAENSPVMLAGLIAEFSNMKQSLIDQDTEIKKLKDIVAHNDDEQKQAISNLQASINDRDVKLMETIRAMQEKPNKTFWQRLFS